MKLKIMLAVATFALLFQGSAGAALDLWVDQNGVVTSRATPAAENPERAKIVSAAVSPALPPAPASGAAAAGKPDTAAVPKVELYVTSWCSYCKQAENFFRTQGIAYTIYDIEKDNSAAQRKEELDSGKGVPLAVINGQLIHGFSEVAYREALKKKP